MAPRSRHVLHGLAWVVGAVGGAAPVALVGDPPAGLVAGAVLGAAAWGWTAPLVLLPWAAVVAASDDDHQVAAALHLAGLAWPRRLVARTVTAAGHGARAAGTAAGAGALAALGTALAARDVTAGLRSAPHAEGVLAAAALGAAAVGLGVLVAAAAVTAARTLVAVAAALVATATTITLASMVPSADALVPLTPWLSLWPFDPDDVIAPTLAREVPIATRLRSMAAWASALTLLAVATRRRTPYPVHEPSRRRRRRPPTRPSTPARRTR